MSGEHEQGDSDRILRPPIELGRLQQCLDSPSSRLEGAHLLTRGIPLLK